jgi:hypothetical protein
MISIHFDLISRITGHEGFLIKILPSLPTILAFLSIVARISPQCGRARLLNSPEKITRVMKVLIFLRHPTIITFGTRRDS